MECHEKRPLKNKEEANVSGVTETKGSDQLPKDGLVIGGI
jgi:hypothetical protein